MRTLNPAERLFFARAPLSLLLLLLAGCASVGPRSIQAGRVAYAEAINRTEDEQMLLSVVKGRYGDTSTLLTVDAVAANIRFRADAGVQAGFGGTNPGESFALGGLAYEENPTITYSPVQGERYIRQVMSPIPLQDVAMLVRSMTDGGRVFGLLVNRVNDLPNPEFTEATAGTENGDFARFLDLFSTLRKEGVLEILGSAETNVVFEVWIGDYAPDHAAEVAELLELLDLPGEATGQDLVLPAYHAYNREKAWGIGISTRSTFDLIEILRASVQVPQEHEQAGLARTYPPLSPGGQGLHIASSRSRPGGMAPAVRYRDYWYYLEETDHATRSAFAIVRTLWSICTIDPADTGHAPVLTIPVN